MNKVVTGAASPDPADHCNLLVDLFAPDMCVYFVRLPNGEYDFAFDPTFDFLKASTLFLDKSARGVQFIDMSAPGLKFLKKDQAMDSVEKR